ncbi:uncharacterized protein LOC131282850 [Anopheles ziemanni]|uniref:uncharacterized protein LOC131267268 n=1 Tax=Anopheles coustani TaxID=139045 RepID=UPI002657C4F0|nr:uncharacterized protein LOC131267268 [Anopheles coustani]XP_058168375.1 uncharacterized protein LOC131282850 [Anopheles ziemanni]
MACGKGQHKFEIDTYKTYDQRQNGKYNIHLNIKDVKIIAVGKENLDGNFGDDAVYDYGDYDYDPAHLTVSPLPIFGSGISAVSITSTSKPQKSTNVAPISSMTISPPVTDYSKTSTAIPIRTTSLKGSIGINLAETTALTHNPSDHFKPQTPTSFPNISSTATPSSNVIKIKPVTAAIHHDYQKIPVKVIVEPIVSPKYRNSGEPIINTN